jgi:hypothetical protein
MDQALDQQIKNNTPIFQEIAEYEDADEEMLFLATHIKRTTTHNEYVEPNNIKFLYSNKPKKEGSVYTLFELSKVPAIYQMLNPEKKYDFCLSIYYNVWKDLTSEQKLMMLDKALCGVDMGSMEKQKISKKSYDSKEYKDNMHFFGRDRVMDTSEMVHLACLRIIEEKKEQARAAREAAGEGKRGRRKSTEATADF